ncbi:MAG: carbon starvation protein A [Myxococcales bacterium]|nr:MAG: carbon starvation protein A [Myxococcales bacterium]
MDSLAIFIAGAAILYFIGYRWYGRKIDRNLLQPDDHKPVPADAHEGQGDYAKAPVPVLFGHHFASIAGAGPIVGPILALSNFGWAATLGWVLIGSILIGAVHDYTALMLSVNNDGRSISDIAEQALGRRARWIFSAFLLLALIIIVAVFSVLAGQTLLAQPQLVIPTFAVIGLAVVFGIAVYSMGMPLWLASIAAFIINASLMALGYFFPIDLRPVLGAMTLPFWIVVLVIYAGVASVVPVKFLLQPRDYISTFNLYTAMTLGALALMIAHPPLQMPAFIQFNSSEGPLWPMMFVIVACGAISGFHSLVASGTTSKQLSRQSDGKKVAFGSMLLEGFVALLTVLMVAGALSWGTGGEFDFQAVNVKGTLMVYGIAYGRIVNQAIPFISLTLGMMIGMITINVFVLTTLDTSTRITRFLVEESLGAAFPLLKNKLLSTSFVLGAALLLALSDSWKAIWPIFGSANQLMAAMTLIVVTAYFVGVKPIRYVVWPAVFMLVTTVGALVWQAYNFIAGKKPDFLLAAIAIVLIVLAGAVAAEGLKVLRAGGRTVPREG